MIRPMRSEYDVIIIGGGHAGAEAAWAASRLGASVALITLDPQKIGAMSCNPAIGGLAKGTRLYCRAIVVTTGTFLRALMHTGERKTEGGRVGEATARGLSACLDG